MDKKLKALDEHLSAALSDALITTEIIAGELCCRVMREALPRVLIFLRDDPNCRFTILCDICGVDYPDRLSRFEGVYHLLCMPRKQRKRCKFDTADAQR